jgi:beta-lactamase class A
VRFDESDLQDYAPVTREHLARGWMTIEEACAAAVVMSDNAAANLLLEIQGGPRALTRFMHANADSQMRLDRNEPSLNEVSPGDERDTTMPEAMVIAAKRLLINEDTLSAAHRETIINWMIESPTGRSRLRAGLPSDWRVGDKTGTWNGTTNAANDVAIAWPPGRAPIIIACYLSASTVGPAERNAAHAEVARIVAAEWS